MPTAVAEPSRASQRDDLRLLLANGSVRRASELQAAGIHPQTIADALSLGMIARTAVGAYYLPEAAPDLGMVGLAAAAARMPKAVVCLRSAAHLWGWEQDLPSVIWLAIPTGAHAAKQGEITHRLLRWSYEGAFVVGIVAKEICGVTVRCTGPARTVVDLLRYRRHLATDGGDRTVFSAARCFVSGGGDINELLVVADALGVPRAVRRTVATVAATLG